MSALASALTPSQALLAAGGAVSAYAVYALFVRSRLGVLRLVPREKGGHWLLGHIPDVAKEDISMLVLRWAHEEGRVLRLRGMFGRESLLLADPRAMAHILANDHIYPKDERSREELSRVFGNGLLVAEGANHRMQRRAMNPAFGPAQVRNLTGVFGAKAEQLRDLWLSQAADENGAAEVDAFDGLTKCTLDIIGLAGFNYEFNALNASGTSSELQRAWATIFESEADTGYAALVFEMMQSYIPPLRLIPTKRDTEIKNATTALRRIGAGLLKEKKAEAEVMYSGKSDTQSDKSRDLLSLLVRANMSPSVAPAQRMSDEDVLSQIPTFLIAGHETTSSAVTWALFALATRPDIQTRLRAELHTLPLLSFDGSTEPLSQEELNELNALPVLDAVLRETLRLHAPVPLASRRVAAQADVVPLSQPFTNRRGEVADSVRVPKGTFISIPIIALNRDPALWGADAGEWKPERWLNGAAGVPATATAIPGPFSHLLTFISGPHACIGYRFALVEAKMILHTLVSAFSFALPEGVTPGMVTAKTGVTARPAMEGRGKGPRMDLVITPVRRI